MNQCIDNGKLWSACIAVWLLLTPAVVAAEPAVRTYTLEDCVRIGLEASEAMLNAYRDRRIADWKERQAASEAKPQFKVTAGYVRRDEVEEFTLEGETVSFGTLDNYSAGARVDQLLWSGGRVRAALRAARGLAELSKWELAETRQELIRDIRAGVADILLARHVVSVREQSVAQLEALLRQTEAKQQAGTASEFEQISAQVKLANERPLLIRARNALELAEEGFRRLVNLGEGPFRVEGTLDLEPVRGSLAEYGAIALRERPALKIMAARVALMQEDVAAAKSGYQPDLRAYFSYNGANSYEFAAFEDEWRWHWNAGVTLSWDLWDGDLTRGRVAEKRLDLEKERTDQVAIRKSVLLQVRQAFLEKQAARETVQAGGDNVHLAQKALDIAVARYENGLATQLDVTDANLNVSRAHLTWYEALRNHAVAVARLEYACGIVRPGQGPVKEP